jgi:hypothetical protein
MAAPLYFNFASFVRDRAEAPIFVSYRSAHAAKVALDHLGVANEELWVNRPVGYNLNLPNVDDYCTGLGLERPFTFVDNGYSGTIPYLLRHKSRFNRLQQIFMVADKRKEDIFNDNNIEFLANTGPLCKRALVDNIESMPRKHESYGTEVLKRDASGGIVVTPSLRLPEEVQIHDAFFAGMKDGFSFCDANPKKFKKYLSTFSGTTLRLSFTQKRIEKAEDACAKIMDIYS